MLTKIYFHCAINSCLQHLLFDNNIMCANCLGYGNEVHVVTHTIILARVIICSPWIRKRMQLCNVLDMNRNFIVYICACTVNSIPSP